MTPDEKLIYMANQIAKFFEAQGEARAAVGVADHIRKFWDPDMRRSFLSEVDQNISKLHPAVKAAVTELKAHNDAHLKRLKDSLAPRGEGE